MNRLPSPKSPPVFRLLLVIGAALCTIHLEMNDFVLKGRILSTSDEPLSEAYGIVLKGRGDFFPQNDQAETGADGTFRFAETEASDCAGVRNGEAIIRFRKTGYKPVLFQHDLPDARTMHIEVILAEEGSGEQSGWRIVVDDD